MIGFELLLGSSFDLEPRFKRTRYPTKVSCQEPDPAAAHAHAHKITARIYEQVARAPTALSEAKFDDEFIGAREAVLSEFVDRLKLLIEEQPARDEDARSLRRALQCERVWAQVLGQPKHDDAARAAGEVECRRSRSD